MDCPAPDEPNTATEPRFATFDRLDGQELDEILQLRSQVVVEQECLFLDQDGVETLHVFFPGTPTSMRDSRGDERGCDLAPVVYARPLGWASSLMTETIGSLGTAPLTLNAQSHLEGFYGSFGFTPNGPRLTEDGIAHSPRPYPVCPSWSPGRSRRSTAASVRCRGA